jgi:hypothetical protein
MGSTLDSDINGSTVHEYFASLLIIVIVCASSNLQ